jgi:proteic killer suppression protein
MAQFQHLAGLQGNLLVFFQESCPKPANFPHRYKEAGGQKQKDEILSINIRHKGLKRLYERGDRSRPRPDIAVKAELFLSVLDEAETIEECDILGFGLHEMKGDRKGFWSVFVSRNHRIVFRFEEGKALDVDLVDYH